MRWNLLVGLVFVTLACAKNQRDAAGGEEVACRAGDEAACDRVATALLGQRTPAADRKLAELEGALCEQGRPTHCTAYAFWQMQGRGMPADVERAEALFRQACPDDPQGCAEFGSLWLEGLGVFPNPKLARLLLKFGCDGNDASACEQLAYCWAAGVGGPVIRPLAVQLLQRACELGRKSACESKPQWFDLANRPPLKVFDPDELPPGAIPETSCVHAGVEACDEGCVAQDGDACAGVAYFGLNQPASDRDAKLVEIARRSCTLGSALGCGVLATFHASGRGVEKSTDEGLGLMRRACQMGDSLACESVGEHASVIADGPRDWAAGADAHLRACELGNTRACMKAVYCIINGKLERPQVDLRRLSGVSCNTGYASGCRLLGLSYLRNDREAQALRAFDRACAMGDAAACARSGSMHAPPRLHGGRR